MSDARRGTTNDDDDANQNKKPGCSEGNETSGAEMTEGEKGAEAEQMSSRSMPAVSGPRLRSGWLWHPSDLAFDVNPAKSVALGRLEEGDCFARQEPVGVVACFQ